MQYKVMVLLSSYNGEKYIREQLDSILTQQGVEVTPLVRDDGSATRHPESSGNMPSDAKTSSYSRRKTWVV